MMLAAILLLTRTAEPIDFAPGAMPLSRCVEALAKQTGLDLRTTPEIAWESMYVNVKQANREVLFAQIARAAAAKWERSGDTFTLSRDQAWVNALQEDSKKQIREQIKEGIKNKAEGQAGVAQEIMASLGPNWFAAIPEGSRVVLSTNPTPMQRPFPKFDRSWPGRLVAANNANVASMDQQQSESDEEMKKVEEVLGKELSDLIRESQKMYMPQRIEGTPAKVLFIAENNGSYVNTDIVMFDQNGKKLGTNMFGGMAATESKTVPTTPDFPEEGGEDKPPAGGAQKPPTKLKPSKATQELMKALGAGIGDPSKFPAELKERLRKLDESDPFDEAATDLLGQYATATKKQLVLCLDDAGSLFQGEATVEELDDTFDDDEGTVKDPDGWRVSAKSDLQPVLNKTLLREAIERFSKGEPTLDDTAWYAGHFEDWNYSSTEFSIVSRVFGLPQYYGYRPLMRLFGKLTDGQRKAAREGKTIEFSSLGKEAKAYLNKIAFGAEHMLGPNLGVIDDPMDMEAFDPKAMMEMQLSQMAGASSLLTEPTEAMPNGLPSTGVIQFQVKTEPAYKPVGQGEMSMLGENESAMTLSALSRMMAMTSFMPAEFAGQAASLREVDEVQLTTLTMTVLATPNVGARERLKEAKGPSKRRSLADWPEFKDRQAKDKKEMEKWSKLFSGMGGFGGRGFNPPPF